MNYLEYKHHIGDKLLSILHTVAGWIVMLVLLLVDYIAGHELDCANIVTVKTALNQINIIRVGITKDRYMRNINTFCYNYRSKKVISNETF